jgi:hypothetical protein
VYDVCDACVTGEWTADLQGATVCVAIPTAAPTKAPTKEPTKAPTSTPTNAVTRKQGLSYTSRDCGDAEALGLNDTWTYNWGLMPYGLKPSSTPWDGSEMCHQSGKEFVPQFWGANVDFQSSSGVAYMDATYGPNWRTVWEDHGVTTILGFNEPDQSHQSNL